MRAPEKRGIYQTLYVRAMRRRFQGRPRMRWVDHIPGGQDWQVAARDCGQAVVEATVGLQNLNSVNGVNEYHWNASRRLIIATFSVQVSQR